MKKYCITVAALLFFQLHLHAQYLEQRISLQFRDVPLEALLQQVSERYFISFSYGNHPLALEKRISVAVAEMPLGEFLRLVLDSAGLTFKVVGAYVVLRQQEKERAMPAEDRQSGRMVEPALTEQPVQDRALHQDTLPRMFTIAPEAPDPAFVPEGSLPTWTISPMVTTLGVLPKLSRQQKSAFMLAPVISLDVARLGLKSEYETNQELVSGLNYSAGLAGTLKLSGRLKAEMLLLYRRKDFTVRYRLDTEGVLLGIPEKTEVALTYVEVPLGIHIRLIRYKRMTFYGLGGLFGSYLLKSREMTWLDDGRLFNTTAMHVHTLSTYLWGVRGGLSAGYALSNKLSFFISPAYQYTINDLKSGTQQIRLQEYTFRSGLWFSL